MSNLIKYAAIGLGAGALIGLAYVGVAKFRKEEDKPVEEEEVVTRNEKIVYDQFSSFRKPATTKEPVVTEFNTLEASLSTEDKVKIEALEDFFKGVINEQQLDKAFAEQQSETDNMIETSTVPVNNPTNLEETIECFKILTLLSEENEEIEEQFRYYADKIRWYKMRKGLNSKGFKSLVKRLGIEPNSPTWTKLFTTLRVCEQRAIEEFEEA